MEQTYKATPVKSDQPNLPRLALTLGDPAGIGPEVVLKALADPAITQQCQVTVVGSHSVLQETYAKLSQQISKTIPDGQFAPLVDPDQLPILDIQLDITQLRQIRTGVGNAASGAVSFACLETAITQAQIGNFQGIVTGPIAKSAWKAAGYNYPGQTELLAQCSSVERFGMLFVAESPHTSFILRTLLATTHIPLRQVADTLTPQLLTTKLNLLVECLQQDFGIASPRIAIAGLNPHSGEQGQLGHEEQEWLIPWIEQERHARPQLQLDGPIPPDTMWVKPAQAWYGGFDCIQPHDAYLALYHDQGLIPVKQLAFDRAVNTSIGLPFVRTSPDHGTAFDIAGQGIADATSMKAAIKLASRLVTNKNKSGFV